MRIKEFGIEDMIADAYDNDVPMIQEARSTEENLVKMMRICYLVNQVEPFKSQGSGVEIRGVMFGPKSRFDGVATDSIIEHDQIITGGDVDSRSSHLTKDRIFDYADEHKLKVVGFFHSHGHHPVFHSGDDQQFDDLNIRDYQGINMFLTGERDVSFGNGQYDLNIEDGELTIISADQLSGLPKKLMLKLNNAEHLRAEDLQEFRIRQGMGTSFLNTITFNGFSYNCVDEGGNIDRGRFNANSNGGKIRAAFGGKGEIYDAQLLVFDRGEEEKPSKSNVHVAIYDENHGIVMDEESILRDILERCIYRGKTLLEYNRHKPKVSETRSVIESSPDITTKTRIGPPQDTLAHLYSGEKQESPIVQKPIQQVPTKKVIAAYEAQQDVTANDVISDTEDTLDKKIGGERGGAIDTNVDDEMMDALVSCDRGIKRDDLEGKVGPEKKPDEVSMSQNSQYLSADEFYRALRNVSSSEAYDVASSFVDRLTSTLNEYSAQVRNIKVKNQDTVEQVLKEIGTIAGELRSLYGTYKERVEPNIPGEAEGFVVESTFSAMNVLRDVIKDRTKSIFTYCQDRLRDAEDSGNLTRKAYQRKIFREHMELMNYVKQKILF